MWVAVTGSAKGAGVQQWIQVLSWVWLKMRGMPGLARFLLFRDRLWKIQVLPLGLLGWEQVGKEL
jgi:hypothetical protein